MVSWLGPQQKLFGCLPLNLAFCQQQSSLANSIQYFFNIGFGRVEQYPALELELFSRHVAPSSWPAFGRGPPLPPRTSCDTRTSSDVRSSSTFVCIFLDIADSISTKSEYCKLFFLNEIFKRKWFSCLQFLSHQSWVRPVIIQVLHLKAVFLIFFSIIMMEDGTRSIPALFRAMQCVLLHPPSQFSLLSNVEKSRLICIWK